MVRIPRFKSVENFINAVTDSKSQRQYATYSSAQLEQIQLGQADDVDTTVYDDYAYNSSQMREIRLGLLSGVDVSFYAKPSIPWTQMLTTRFNLERNKQRGESEESMQMRKEMLTYNPAFDVTQFDSEQCVQLLNQI